LSDKGEVLLLRPNPEKYDVISRFELPEGGEGQHWAHPVVIGKRLYLRHGTFLYCYDVAKAAVPEWLNDGRLQWKSSPPLVMPENRPDDPCFSVKDPTIVFY
jgi:hypothetical protein